MSKPLKVHKMKVQEFSQRIIQRQFEGKYKPFLEIQFTAGVHHRAGFLKAVRKREDVIFTSSPGGKKVSVTIPIATTPIGIMNKEDISKNLFSFTCYLNRKDMLPIKENE